MDKFKNRKVVLFLVLIAFLGLTLFIIIASSAQFRDTLFNALYPKKESGAQEAPSNVSLNDEDRDDDGWKDGVERLLGTNQRDNCSDTKDEAAWPPDFNNDSLVTTVDFELLRVALDSGKYDRRYDLNIDKKLDSADADIFVNGNYIGKSCLEPLYSPVPN